jgi:2-keto-3-deoxy-L-rhamnonate aldolase RhmA
MADTLTLKQRIHNSEIIKIAGASVNTTKAQLEEVLSKDSYDLVGVDAQHSAFNEEKLATFCATAADLGVPVQLRIKNTRQAYLIGNMVDLGPLAIVVPQVETEETVDEAINAFYYPQVGKRSWGPSGGYGIKQGFDRLEYAEWWNNHGILILQLESVDAVVNARKLAKPGVDMFVFGANDLNFSLESYTNPPFGSVEECIQHVVDQMAGTSVKVGAGNSPSGRL